MQKTDEGFALPFDPATVVQAGAGAGVGAGAGAGVGLGTGAVGSPSTVEVCFLSFSPLGSDCAAQATDRERSALKPTIVKVFMPL